MTSTIDVALGFDDAYAPHAAATIASAVACAPDANFRFILICSEVSDARRAMVEKAAPKAKFVWTLIQDGDMPKFNNRDYFTRAILFRLGLEKYAPADSQRIIYLDSDMTVLRDLRDLWKTDLKGNVAGAVHDTFVIDTEFSARWSLPKVGPGYFNSGMMLIDMELVRKEKLFAAALDVVAKHGDEMRFADQDALNYVLWGRWLPLDVAWNLQRDMIIPSLAVNLPKHKTWAGQWPGVVHFTGTDKPWTPKGWHPWAWIYWRSLTRTPFESEVAKRYHVEPMYKLKMMVRWMRHKPRSPVTP